MMNPHELDTFKAEMVQKVSQLIVNRRKELGIGIRMLETLSGVDKAHIWRIENGHKPRFSLEITIKLFRALKIDFSEIDELIEED